MLTINDLENMSNKELREVISDCERELEERISQAAENWRTIYFAIKKLSRKFPNLEVGWKDKEETEMFTISELYDRIYEDIDFFGIEEE